MPVRNVSNRGGNIIGKFPSIKMGRMVAFESLLERDFIYLLDYAEEVTWFEEQPLTIEYQEGGKTLHYTSDFHVVEGGENVLVECKPERFVEKDENRRKFVAARNWCAQRNWAFRIVTGREVRAGFRLQNVKLLTRYARQRVDPTMQGRICGLLYNCQAPLTMDDIVTAIPLADPGAVTACLLRMAFHHEIAVPLDDAPLSGETAVRLPARTQKEGEK
jgi:hypothetical protein